MTKHNPKVEEKLYCIVLQGSERALHRIEGKPVFKSIESYKRDLRVMGAEEAALVATNCTYFFGEKVEFKEYRQQD